MMVSYIGKGMKSGTSSDCVFADQPPESVRLRFAFLQQLNNHLETFFLPLVDLRPATTFSRSTAALLSKLRSIIFYDSKINFLNRILNATAKRKPDHAAPEITLDPLESIGGKVPSVENQSIAALARQAECRMKKRPVLKDPFCFQFGLGPRCQVCGSENSQPLALFACCR